MRVLAYDVRCEPFLADLLGFEYVALERLLPESDIVSVRCPLLPEAYEPHSVERLHATVQNRALLARDDVVFTPHNAFNSARPCSEFWIRRLRI
jgi:phosphoglycerate dehydrogenase-like enzyme